MNPAEARSSALIRPATVDDIPAILDIERQTQTAHWPVEKYRQLFAAAEPHRKMLIAEDESGPVGFGILRLIPSEAEIENLAVAINVQRNGIGMRLLQCLVKVAFQRGALSIYLEVRESNIAARALYNKAGFRENGRRAGYYRNPGEDAILYRLVSE